VKLETRLSLWKLVLKLEAGSSWLDEVRASEFDKRPARGEPRYGQTSVEVFCKGAAYRAFFYAEMLEKLVILSAAKDLLLG
jgi:hypothetical protein